MITFLAPAWTMIPGTTTFRFPINYYLYAKWRFRDAHLPSLFMMCFLGWWFYCDLIVQLRALSSLIVQPSSSEWEWAWKSKVFEERSNEPPRFLVCVKVQVRQGKTDRRKRRWNIYSKRFHKSHTSRYDYQKATIRSIFYTCNFNADKR